MARRPNVNAKRADHSGPDNHNFITLQKYNAKDQDFFSDNGLIGLKYDLSVILKAFKKALN
jgi:hypothetical protein